jgi:hypothetical protein
MDKYFAFLFTAIGAVYADTGADSFLYGYLLPGLFLIGACYLLTVPGFLILSGATITFYFIDVSSTSIIESVVLPLLFVCWIIFFIVWAWRSGHLTSAVHWGGGESCGGDFGGGGDGCGGDGGGC